MTVIHLIFDIQRVTFLEARVWLTLTCLFLNLWPLPPPKIIKSFLYLKSPLLISFCGAQINLTPLDSLVFFIYCFGSSLVLKSSFSFSAYYSAATTV